MDLAIFFKDKATKPQEKIGLLAVLLKNKELSGNELAQFAKTAKDAIKGSCIEAMEHVSKEMPQLIENECFDFVIESLASVAPRVKMESGRVVANCIHLFPDKIEKVANHLLVNTTDEGTVVRWSAATALLKIVLLKTEINKELVPALKTLADNEEKNSIKKIYQEAIKKSGIK